MITPESDMRRSGLEYIKPETFFGLSSDIPKPVANICNGSCFIEMDTSKIYFFNEAGAEWLEWGAESEAT